MTFDVTFFGYGAALVMLPYVVGMAVGMVWKAINAVSMR